VALGPVIAALILGMGLAIYSMLQSLLKLMPLNVFGAQCHVNLLINNNDICVFIVKVV